MARPATQAHRRGRLGRVCAVVVLVAAACGANGDDEPTTDGAGPVAASATSDDTFDPAFYNPDAGSFPALDDPEMVQAADATWLAPDDIVMGISDGQEARAFPVDQMAYHHVANTRLAGEPFVVTY